jgi:hypothetical protein
MPGLLLGLLSMLMPLLFHAEIVLVGALFRGEANNLFLLAGLVGTVPRHPSLSVAPKMTFSGEI